MYDQSIIFLNEGRIELIFMSFTKRHSKDNYILCLLFIDYKLFYKKKCSLIRVTLSKCYKIQRLEKVETVL